MKLRGLLISSFAVAICAATAVAGYQQVRFAREEWREIAWPFPRDGWPAGRAFHCEMEACGGEVEVYVRPKIGFCNCDTGVADDDEVDRVADLDLMSERFVPLEAGRAARIADMPGRLRSYELQMPDGTRHTAVGIAVSRGCDLMVAVAKGAGAAPVVRRVALDFLTVGQNDALDDLSDGWRLRCPFFPSPARGGKVAGFRSRRNHA